METQNLPTNSIFPFENNPRENEDAVDFVAKSIELYGFRQPIVVDSDMVIVVGHTRHLAAIKLGLETVPVHIAEDLSPEKARAYRIADNKSHELSDWDDEKLLAELKELQAFDVNIEDLGFSEAELKQMIDDFDSSSYDENEDLVPDAPEEPITQPGDMWELGDHRVICGDSLSVETLSALFGDQKAQMVFTDPPYNIDYGKTKVSTHKVRSIENDNMGKSEWIEFCTRIGENCQQFCTGDVYIWGASGPDGMRQRLIFHDMGIHWSATIIWKKNSLVLSPAKYQRIYEPCFYGWPKKSSFSANRKKTEYWEFDRPTRSELHPTMKPVALCEHGIINSSLIGNIVADFFLGSGSTLIACEKANRKCYGVELDPRYCDVIVKRWEDFTGKKGVLKKSFLQLLQYPNEGGK